MSSKIRHSASIGVVVLGQSLILERKCACCKIGDSHQNFLLFLCFWNNNVLEKNSYPQSSLFSWNKITAEFLIFFFSCENTIIYFIQITLEDKWCYTFWDHIYFSTKEFLRQKDPPFSMYQKSAIHLFDFFRCT